MSLGTGAAGAAVQANAISMPMDSMAVVYTVN
jgi:hypothetical protein